MKNFTKQTTYTLALMAVALSACGKIDKKPSLGDKSIPVKESEGPKVVMSCTLKNDPDDMFYLYRNSDKQVFLTETSDPKSKPLTFKLVDNKFATFPITKDKFLDKIDVASVRQQSADETGWIAVVSNSEAKTLEIVKYQKKTAELDPGAITEAALIADTKVLFSSGNCVPGQSPNPDKTEKKSILEEITEEMNQVLADTPTASKDAIAEVRALLEKK